MNRIIDISKWLFSGALLVCLFVLPGQIQAADGETMTLEEAIQKISYRYDVYFTYNKSLIQELTVDYSEIEDQSLEEAMEQVLAGTLLRYRIHENKYVIIYRRDREGITSLKKMARHLDDLIVSEEKREKSKINVVRQLGATSTLGSIHLEKHRIVHNVSGTVTDQAGESLIGVNVVVKGTNKGTATDFEGRFTLEDVNEQATLVFSYVGYQTQEVDVKGRTNISVTMTEDLQTLDEVVVVGYGTQKKVNLTGAVDVVSGDELSSRPASQVSQLLQGKTSSTLVTMNMRGGEPGAGQSIQVRGFGSIKGDTKPLVLVDGVEMDMNLVDPASIESISILKDASASAIYGSRAAFGVILIQTKKGADQPTRVRYSNITSLNVPYYTPDMYDSYTYATVFNQARANAGLSPTFGHEQVDRIKGYIDGTYQYPYNPDQPPFNHWRGRWDGNANVNWGQEYFTNSILQKHNINIEGGNEKLQFYTSLGYLDEPGIIRWGNDKFKRYNLLGNLSARATDWLKFDFSARYAKNITDRPNGGVWGDRSGYWMHFNILWPTMPKYNIDGSVHNPIMVALMDGGRVITEHDNSRFSVGTEIEPVPGWKTFLRYNYTTRLGSTVDHMFPVETTIANGTTGNIGFAQSALQEVLQTGNYSVLTAFTQYEKSLANHNFSAMLGYEHDYSYNRNMIGLGADLISDQVPSISTALGTKEISDQIYHWATQAGFGRLNYDFDGKYLVELNARYDGSSKFAPGQRWGFFPSGSVGYILSRENFWASAEPVVQYLKLRASYGSLGNQAIRGPQLIRRGQSFEEVSDPNVTNYLYLEEIPIHQRLFRIIDGVRPIYADMPAIASEFLTWETITTTNLGIDAGMLNNRLMLEFDWYKRITDDMIGPSVELPSVLGAGAPTTNNAKLETVGYEFSLEWRDDIKNFEYNAKFGLGDYKSTILEYVNETGYVHGWYPGKRVGDVWGLTTAGLIQTDAESSEMADQSYYFTKWGPGDIKYADLNNDGKIDPGQNTLDDHGDLSIIANTTPRYQFSFSGGVKWKNLDLNMFWQGIAKRLFVPDNRSEYYFGHVHTPANAILLKNSEYHLDYWRPADETNFLGPNTDAYQPRPYFSNERNKNFQTQSRFIDNANYVRLKNLQLGYTLPGSVTSRTPFADARIYFSGENLLTFQSMPKAFEPESMISSGSMMRTYPIRQMYSIGLNITF